MILSGGDRYVALVQLLALVAACFAIAGIARRLGFGRSAAAFGALVFATFTVVLLQTPTALNDLVVALFLIVCAYFAIGELAHGARTRRPRARAGRRHEGNGGVRDSRAGALRARKPAPSPVVVARRVGSRRPRRRLVLVRGQPRRSGQRHRSERRSRRGSTGSSASGDPLRTSSSCPTSTTRRSSRRRSGASGR